jgi:NAD(P)-dependent dehydrogenase (short-subunit alcohol dehydrogenase family)
VTGRVGGKTALVTGAASRNGIGFATARALAREGANVLLTDLDATEVKARAAELESEGLHARGMIHDVTREVQWTSALDAAEAEFGPVDVLVNNAGITILQTLDALTPADWTKQLDVNLTSVYLGCRTTLERMRRFQLPGSIVNAVRLFTKSLALEAAPEGIRVNSVHPGVIQTKIQKVAMADGGENSRRIHAAIPMQRMGRPEDVAVMILFLASDEAAYVTGAEFVVDGGLTAQ